MKNRIALPTLLVALSLAFAGAAGISAQTVNIKVFATTDVHNNYMNYDYFSDLPAESYGLVKIAGAIGAERAVNPNVLLFDDGDSLQGNPFGDYVASRTLKNGQANVIMQLYDAMKYDAMALGNHEFNFGLDYLDSAIAQAGFPVLCANVVKAGTLEPRFTPWVILDRNFADTEGVKRKIRIGVIGLVPPQIALWDASALKGQVETLDMYETAARYVPEMKRAGADMIVCLNHSGINDFPRRGGEENTAYYMTAIPGVDLVIAGHAHQKFPGAAFATMPGADIAAGTINGVPVVMAGSFADTLGAVDISLEYRNGAWAKASGRASLLPVWDSANRKSLMEADAGLVQLLAKTHEDALAYIRAPIGEGSESGGTSTTGEMSAPLTSFFALVRDDYSVQIINEAQLAYGKELLKGSAYAGLPLLSAAAPFKAGGRQGPKYYTDIPAGPIAIKNIADLYVYANTVCLVKLTGAEMKEWLEMSAGQYARIDPAKTGEQYLVNDKFPSYLFDIIEGLSYEIDVTQGARYNEDGTLRDASAERVGKLIYAGEPIDPRQEFVVVTNNYRANGGGNIPGVSSSKIIFSMPDESRQVILQYINAKKTIDPSPDGNWKIAPFRAEGPVFFYSSPRGASSMPPGIRYAGAAETGFGKFFVEFP
jgi:2',3'-cyclic-nucleotide 2'-phosphodiesterase/3'-nucleotidase